MAEIKETMELGYYFMNLEDKYWGLFLIVLAVLFFLMEKDKKSYPIYGFTAYLFLLCPATVYVLVKCFPALAVYYPVRWICQIPVFLSIGFVMVLDKVRKEQEFKKVLATGVFLVFLLFLSGTPVFFAENEPGMEKNGLEPEYVETYEMLLADMEERGLERAAVWGPKDWMEDCRVYSGALCPIYGKDMWESNIPKEFQTSYSDNQRILYEFYSTYESVTGPLSNKWQQVEVLADTLNTSSDVKCDYVVMHRGTNHWKERGSKVKRLDNVDVEGAFLNRDYEEVGYTENYYLFYKGTGE